ncbi:dysbindin protein homolog [Drosophila pseudoobscura]|uniref:Dysbindin protein homolog n=1 Tax=Drosophila pseudoobscura pseudoobscura TaxID=46245 RepID=A0A6I8UCS9_DROPS|nr:dysbindin protein homolog [Drosophila pseudoobscura]
MFGSLKKKLSSAIQEGIVISESLQQQYRQRVSSGNGSGQSSAATTPTSPLGLNESLSSSRSSSLYLGAPFHLTDGVPPHLNVAAGCSLLAKYEDDWQQIHVANEENAERAAAVATQITAVQERASGQRKTISDLSGSLAGIPTLITKLQASIETLHALEDMGKQLEIELEKLEDLCEECELQEFMLEKQFELSRHKQKKLNELEKYRHHIASRHQAKIQDHEQQLRKLQRERQAVFDDAFRGDMEEYKQHGQLTKIQAAQATSNKLALEEVVLEANEVETKDALEQFLNG